MKGMGRKIMKFAITSGWNKYSGWYKSGDNIDGTLGEWEKFNLLNLLRFFFLRIHRHVTKLHSLSKWEKRFEWKKNSQSVHCHWVTCIQKIFMRSFLFFSTWLIYQLINIQIFGHFLFNADRFSMINIKYNRHICNIEFLIQLSLILSSVKNLSAQATVISMEKIL